MKTAYIPHGLQACVELVLIDIADISSSDILNT